MRQPVAYSNGRFVPATELGLSVSDLGFIHGATIAEQIRTFGGEIFELDRHLDRFWNGLETIGVDHVYDRARLATDLNELVQGNRELLDPADDLGLCFFATPGQYPGFEPAAFNFSAVETKSTPTLIAHTYPLPFSRWAGHYECGFHLVRSTYQEVPAVSWTKAIKCRSRMHYYLADLEAEQISPGSKPVLCDAAGHVRDSSIASIICYDADRGLLTPGGEGSLASISVAVVRELADQLQIPFHEGEIPYSKFHAFDEVMLASTPWSLAPVCQVDEHTLRDAKEPIFDRLMDAWSRKVSVDIIQQAKQFAIRS